MRKTKLLQKNYSLLSKIIPLKNRSKNLIVLTLIFSWMRIHSQEVINYVNNPGFETALPSATFNPVDAAKFWSSIDSTSNASYYLIGIELGSAPYCSFGFQFPRNGNSFIISSFYCTSCPRWYPRNRLKRQLKPNTTYCAKYFVVNTNNNRIAIDSYGVYFGNSSIDTVTQASIPLTYLNPQIENTNGVITDTLNWIPITGTFVATGTEKYMILGNFKSNASTNTLLINTPTLITMTNDIYIDDVSLIELNLPAFAGRDTSVVPGDSIFLGRQPDIGIDEACMWYKLPTVITPTTPAIDTIAGFWIKPVTSCTYIVRQEICGLVKWDTVRVDMNPVGLEKLKMIKEELKIYPVPADDYMELRIANEEWLKEFTSLTIYNHLGVVIREEEIRFGNKNTKIEVVNLPAGVYSLHLKSNRSGTVSK